MALELPLQQCMVGVVDVGSTGSRLHVYTYDCKHKEKDIHEVWAKRITPGFASISSKQPAIDNYLNQLFFDAPKNIPIYFYATAGMRLLSYDEQKTYYNAVYDWFEHSDWSLIEAKTITGRDEGVFAWLAVNRERKNLSKNNDEDIGVMDMGGASVQIVMLARSSEGKNPDDLVHVEFEDQEVTLFVHSFLGLGGTLVSQQFLNNPACFPEGYPLPDGSMGHGDAIHCEEAVSQLVNNVHAVNRVVQPALSFEKPKKWYVLGGLAYLLKKEPFRHEGISATNEWLLQQANQAVCQRVWPDLHLDYPDNEGLSISCLMASYYHALMNKGYGLHSKELLYLTASSHAETDWTLGVVLHQH